MTSTRTIDEVNDLIEQHSDGDQVNRSTVNDPVYGETPWEATYECELILKRGKYSIEIKVISEVEGMTRVISDWAVTVK